MIRLGRHQIESYKFWDIVTLWAKEQLESEELVTRALAKGVIRDGLKLQSVNFEVIEEILVKAYARGFSIVEVPFTYFPRGAGRSHAKLFQFGWQIVKSSLKLWKLINQK